jgi:hypothetical protein
MRRDERRDPRRTVKAEFHTRDGHGAGTLVFEASDVSAGGAFLRSDLLLEKGELLTLEIFVADGGLLEIRARVAWVRRFPKEDEHPGMGIEFLLRDGAERALLDQALAALTDD